MITINATVRDVKDQGKSSSRRLRAKNKFPAVVYGGTEQAISIVLEQDIITNLESKPGFYAQSLTLIIDDKVNNVKVQAMQCHPFKPKFTHIDFVRVPINNEFQVTHGKRRQLSESVHNRGK